MSSQEPNLPPKEDYPCLPDGWASHFDRQSQRYYFSNQEGLVTWDPPSKPKPSTPPPPPPPPPSSTPSACDHSSQHPASLFPQPLLLRTPPPKEISFTQNRFSTPKTKKQTTLFGLRNYDITVKVKNSKSKKVSEYVRKEKDIRKGTSIATSLMKEFVCVACQSSFKSMQGLGGHKLRCENAKFNYNRNEITLTDSTFEME